ncbi:MANSC domain-containing protein 1 [Ochotona princeps]|uniref:MANSC domain-containing protein 1 n=1 Tax=Ochotona princeps TaxID=9978 RepID=UPI0027150592|nr:MANSC domain-containing protein 1 [Ochotona princeps]
MSTGKGRGWACSAALLCFLAARLSSAQQCLSESLADVVIDIQSSLSKGIRGSEPVHVPTQQDCIRSCCSTQNISGDKACNLMIFDTRKTAGQPNCYLFFCPTAEACPLKPAQGLRSFRVIRDSPTPVKPEVPRPEAAGEDALIHGHWPQTAAPTLLSPTLDHSRSGDLSRSPGSLEKLKMAQEEPADQENGQTQNSTFSSQQQTAMLPLEKMALLTATPAAASPSATTATAEPAAVLSTVVPSVALRGTPGTSLPHTTPISTGSPRTPAWITLPTAIFQASTRSGEVFKTRSQGVLSTRSQDAISTAPAGEVAAARTVAPLDPVQNAAPLAPSLSATAEVSMVSLEGRGDGDGPRAGSLSRPPPSGLPEGRGRLPFEKWLLLGTLLLGVLFLVIGLALLGRIVADSLRRKRYSRLDYLINGIYVDL